MPTEPRPRSAGTADEAAALAFVEAAAAAEAAAHDAPPAPDASGSAQPQTTDASAHAGTRTDASAARGRAAPPPRLAPPPGAPRWAGAAHDDLAAAREQRIRRLLDFEGGWASHGGAKARAIRAEFGWSTTRYYQVLDGLLETPEAVRHDPMLVRRLLRLREGR